MAWVLVSKSRMVCLENLSFVRAECRVNEVVLFRRIVVLIVQPSVPGGCNFLRQQLEFAVVRVLHPPSGVVVGVVEVLVVAVAELVLANKASSLISVATLFHGVLVRLSSEKGPHQAFSPVNLCKSGAHHAHEQSPGSHFF